MSNQLSPRTKAEHDKDFVSLKHWLDGRGYLMALYILEDASQVHTGTRKDGTYEFNHQVVQAHYIRTIVDSLSYPEETISAIFVHDKFEDYDVTFEESEIKFREKNKTLKKHYEKQGREAFNVEKFMTAAKHLTKVYKGKKKDTQVYFDEMVNDEIASIAKGADRMHNVLSMGGAFTKEKQASYVKETEDYILPMLKKAQRHNPEQGNAYENVKLVLKIELNIIKKNLGLDNESTKG